MNKKLLWDWIWLRIGNGYGKFTVFWRDLPTVRLITGPESLCRESGRRLIVINGRALFVR